MPTAPPIKQDMHKLSEKNTTKDAMKEYLQSTA
jgi:hypothetical protein